MSGVTGGITGTDLGFPIEYKGKLYFLFGDSREFHPDLCEPGLCGTEAAPIKVLQKNSEQLSRWRTLEEWNQFVAHRGDGRDSLATASLQFDPDQCIPIRFETTEVGLIFGHEIQGDTIGDPFQLQGRNVATNPQDKWVLVMGNRILVITNDGSVFVHDIPGNSIGIPFQLRGPKVAANSVDKKVLVMGDRILVITTDGNVFAHKVIGDEILPAVQLSGPRVAANPQDKWVLVMGNGILVITNDGRVFVHEISSDTIEVPFQIAGPKVAANAQDKWVITLGDRVLVITKDGRIFAHRLTRDAVGVASRLNGPRVAANPRDNLVVAMSNQLLVLTKQDGTFRPTRVNGNPLGRKEGAIGAFTNGPSLYAFLTERDMRPDCGIPEGCAHDDEPPGGKTVLVRAMGDDNNFERLMLVSKTKFLWAVPEVAQSNRIPGLEGTSSETVFVWGSGRTNNDTGINVAKWNHSYPFLAVAPLSGVEEKQNWRYFAGLAESGLPNWQKDEGQAQPVLGFEPGPFGKGYHECLGYFSVKFLESWGRWVMLYACNNDANDGYNRNNGQRGIYMRTSALPWGPWSDPLLIFNPDDGYCRFMHNARDEETGECKDRGPNAAEESVRRDDPPVNRNDESVRRNPPPTKRGWAGEYAPIILPSRYARVAGDETTLYFLMSTWNPYQVVLMKTQIKPAAD
jgi:hypothetical protein